MNLFRNIILFLNPMIKKIFAISFLIVFFTQGPLAKTNLLNKTSIGLNPAVYEYVEFFPSLESNHRIDLYFHNDSIHQLNFRYKDKKRGIKPFIAPTLLIATGTALYFSPNTNENFQDWMGEHFSYSGHVDDYIQYAPIVAVYGLNAVGIKRKNNFVNRTAFRLKSLWLNDLVVSRLKSLVNSERPNGGMRSFPSGHTSVAFATAHFMHKEFGEKSIWYSIGAYACASTVGMMRVAKDAHWISDVVAGAGFGILSTELVYLTHLYKWDNEHIKNFDIFPWRSNRQTGIAMVYKF